MVDLLIVFEEFFGNGKSRGMIQHLEVIMKSPRAKNIKDYRPISRISSLYKIIPKVLANIVKSVLHEVVGKINVHYLWRSIHDGILIANESVANYRSKDERALW